MDKLKSNIENYAFGVCSYIGDKLDINSNIIRLYFIYVSFFTLGSPIIIYFIMAFWLNVKKYTRQRNHSVWDL